MQSIRKRAVCCATSLVFVTLAAHSAQGEMGTGYPLFGSYSAATGVQTIVWRVDSATLPFPRDCTALTLTLATMGADGYRVAVETLLAAKINGRRVRFFAHAPRDSGCGVDYIELL